MLGRDVPVWKAVHEAGDGEQAGVADQGREGDDEDEDPEDQPAGGDVPPLFRGGQEGVEYLLVVDEEQYRQDE